MSWIWLVVEGDELRFAPGDEPEPEGALRADPRAHDPDGDPARVWLTLAPEGVSIPFDDPAVSSALRSVLAGPPPRLVSTLLRDEVRFAGALFVPEEGAERVYDPFERLFPTRVLDVGAGTLARVAPPAGPGIARYAGGAPWPWNRFD